MARLNPVFPANIWDGLSENIDRKSRLTDVDPNSQDFDRLAAELISVEQELDEVNDALDAVGGPSVIGDMVSDIATLQGDVTDLQDDLDTLNTTVSNLAGDVVAQGAEIDEMQLATRTVTGNVTLTSGTSELVLVDASSGPITVNLPAAVPRIIKHIKKIDSTANTVTVDANGAQTIDGDATLIIQYQWSSCALTSDGTNWYIT